MAVLKKKPVRNKVRNYKGLRKETKTVLEVKMCEDKVNVARAHAGLDFTKQSKELYFLSI